MIHDLDPGTFDASYRNLAGPGPEDRVLCFAGNDLLWQREGERYILPRYDVLRGLPEQAEFTYAFMLCNERCFLTVVLQYLRKMA
jgi:hypothetical protein